VADGGAVIDPTIAAQLLTDYRRLINQDAAGSEASFSSRELKMLRHLSVGESNRDIAQHLFLSEQTVKNLLSEIYRKLGAENRTEAVSIALCRGLIRGEAQL
jgi:DNA-binding NarL/FixJ family response regulator